MASPTFADLLRESGVLPEAQLARVLWAHAQSAAPVWQVVLEQTLCTEDHLFEAVARAARLPRLNLRLARVERAATERVDPAWAEAQRIAPLWRDAARGTLAVAMVDPTDYASVDHLGRVTGLEITREVASPSEVAVLLEHQFHGRELNRTPAPWNREAERHEDADDLVEDEKSSGSYDSWNIPKETLRAAETAAAL
ncbi:MAG: hypothetical protein KC933_38355, partial [Myxococcales bacterium]|nr:hypothetical protein [Myxococcales bacterium]